MLRTASNRWVLIGLAAGWAVLLAAPRAAAQDRSVTVIAILATDKNNRVDDKLKSIADEVKKVEPTLTGFRIAHQSSKALNVGQREVFALVDREEASVTLVEVCPKDDNRYRLTVKAPMVGEITYSCCCSKFFPILTRYQTKNGERLILAVMVKPSKK
ncbi:MAG: hypothetical protein JNM56_36110 [Planctomycetia bacterium]|nr:hypothetical protein [Planctomycetia bacterium]